MATQKIHPTLRETLDGYRRFNIWESTEQQRELARLGVEEGLTQFFELCSLAQDLAPDGEQISLEQDKIHWARLRAKLQRLANVKGRAKKTR